MRDVGINISDKIDESTEWADEEDHTKTFGTSPLGFWQWNVNIFCFFSTNYSYAIPDTPPPKTKPKKTKSKPKKPIKSTLRALVTTTITIDLLDKDEKTLSSAYLTLKYNNSKTGNNDEGWKYTYRLTSSEIVYGTEKITEFNGIRAVVVITPGTTKTGYAEVRFFSPVPSKDMADSPSVPFLSFTPWSMFYTVREVFHLGERKEESTGSSGISGTKNL